MMEVDALIQKVLEKFAKRSEAFSESADYL